MSFPAPTIRLAIEKAGKDNLVITQQSGALGGDVLLYSIHQSDAKPHVTITRANDLRDVVGTISFHSLSSKIETTLRGEPIQLKRKDLFADAHSFRHHSVGEMHWKESSFLGSGVILRDSQKRNICRYRKRHGFEMLVPIPDQNFMDLVVVTGFAAAEYRRRSNKDWDEVLKETIKDIAGV